MAVMQLIENATLKRSKEIYNKEDEDKWYQNKCM